VTLSSSVGAIRDGELRSALAMFIWLMFPLVILPDVVLLYSSNLSIAYCLLANCKRGVPCQCHYYAGPEARHPKESLLFELKDNPRRFFNCSFAKINCVIALLVSLFLSALSASLIKNLLVSDGPICCADAS